METGDGKSPETVEPVSSETQSLEEFDSRDALLAALGSLTLDCLGTVNPSTYLISKSGVLFRNFSKCVVKGSNEDTVKAIDAILGVANSEQGKKDQLMAHYVTTWKNYQQKFPEGINVCPVWKKEKVLNPPTWESVKQHSNGNGIGKEGYVYTVSDEQQCKGDPKCEVAHALACAGGFGSQFLIGGNVKNSTVTVDPAWWLTRYEYETDAANPFMMPGYYHAMSYYGDLPGSFYGAVQREGESCSQYDASSAKHYTDRKLVGIDCGGGWVCMTYCMVPPAPPPPPPPPSEPEPEPPAS
jgi:hypothetical protein